QIFPALTSRYFANQRGVDYAVGVRVTDDPHRVLYISDPALTPASFGSGDVQLGMFALRPEELRSLTNDAGLGGHRRRPPEPAHPAEGHHRESGPWQLMIKHRDGSLEEAVAAIRRRNLAISLGILALLGATAGMMFVTTQRAQRLAQQQIEFVAGVTPQMNTPVPAL